MKSYRLFIIIVSVLVAVNCVLLGVFWFKKDSNFMHRNGPPPAANAYLSKELNLTAAQQKEYDILRKQHFEFTKKLNEQNHQLRDDFFDNIKTTALDTAVAFAIERKIATIQVMLDTATLNHFRKLRSILDAGQQIKFDHIIKNALHMMGGQQQHGREPGPGGMPPHDGMPPPPDGGPEHGQGPPPDGIQPPPPPGN